MNMEKPIAYACPITHQRWGENEFLPEEECEFKFEVMPEIQAKLDSGLCILMEIADPTDSGSDEVIKVSSNEAERTGRMAFVSKNMLENLFGPGHGDVQQAFVNKEIMDSLEEMSAKLAASKKEVEQIPGDVAESVDFEELDNE